MQSVPEFVLKIIQLYETMNVRFRVMEVGPTLHTGGRKTTCYRILQAAMTKLCLSRNPNPAFQITRSYVLNPKCIKMGELHFMENIKFLHLQMGGQMDLGAPSYDNALLTQVQTNRKWIIFDGPVDAFWIE